MQPRKHLLATCRVLLIAALLAACAAPAVAPTAIPAPPTDTLAPSAAESDPVAVVQAWVEALNSGDMDAAMVVFIDDPKFQFWKDKAAGVEEVRSMIDWMAGKGTQFQIADCEWLGTGIQCALSVSDGCIAAYGASGGLSGKMTFYSLEDGTLRQVVGVLGVAERKTYQTWLETETTWAADAHADELAQTEGYSKEGGEMAVQLCQEYATAQK